MKQTGKQFKCTSSLPNYLTKCYRTPFLFPRGKPASWIAPLGVGMRRRKIAEIGVLIVICFDVEYSNSEGLTNKNKRID
ncbi:hypothetical protein N9164_03960 [Draconibacterium sp.]|nr:hypothetical protein [Draconibacterium sp.]